MNQSNPFMTVFDIIKGHSREIDSLMFLFPKSQEMFWGIVTFQWGLLADIDFESEKVCI